MLEASNFLLGNHDFRNFCRVTLSNPVKHFFRTIHSISIETIDSEFCTLTVIGNAFLHNQIRNIASVLVSVGLGYEDISIVEKLLNINEYPDKPAYSLLSGLPLILYDCAYENVEWQSPSMKHNGFSKQKHKF
uniref:tRNA pseudouridine synthase n=1 Tax=Myxobolus squamalis TaxID=59785 RepID=A0A6B2FZN1_MYXSQ